MLRVEYTLLPFSNDAVDTDLLDDGELRRAAQFVTPSARARFIAVRGALRRALAQRLSVDPGELRFSYGASGKPALAPPFDRARLEFSVAHSHGLALLAFARAIPVGADVERLRVVRDPKGLAKRVLSEHENARLAKLTGDRWTEAFFRLWTRKEALVKCRGGSVLAPASDGGVFGWADVPVPSGYVATIGAEDSEIEIVERPLYSAG